MVDLEEGEESYNVVPFGKQLKLAAKMNLDYWENREQPPNLPKEAFSNFLKLIDDDVVPRWKARESTGGKHGKDGEETCFYLNISRRLMGREEAFFIKGYFFTREKRQGVTIQSFRKDSPAYSTERKSKK